MNVSFMKEFITFVKTLNYTKAANELFLSQPTLRAHIRAIECELGGPLVAKRDGQLTLTPMGRLFLKKARVIVADFDEMLEECNALARASTSLTVGFLELPWIEDLFVKARETFCDKHPEATVELLFSPKMNANVESVSECVVDMTTFPLVRTFDKKDEVNQIELPGTLRSVFIDSQEVCFWMTSRNPLFGKDRLHAADLEGMTLVLGNTSNMNNARSRYAEYFSHHGVHIEVDNQPFSSYSDYFLQDSPDTFGIVMESVFASGRPREGFRMFSVEEFSMVADLYILYDEQNLNACASGYLEELKRLLADSRGQEPAS